jgi:hypothetical protein
MKMYYEFGDKSHITSAPGSVNQSPDFKSIHRQNFVGIREFDREHHSQVKKLKNILSSSTYTIGRKTSTPPGMSPGGLKTPNYD